MKTAASSWSSTANYSTTSNAVKNSFGKGIASALTVIRKSFRTFGRITPTRCGSGCADNLPSLCGISDNDNSILDVIALVSRHFSGADRATGCSLLPKSKVCLLQEWFRRDPTATDSKTYSHFLRSKGRGLVLQGFNFCRRDS